jgi:hypothetical protein
MGLGVFPSQEGNGAGMCYRGIFGVTIPKGHKKFKGDVTMRALSLFVI